MVFAGTMITGGAALALVTATGMSSEIGKIQSGVTTAQGDEENMPLSRKARETRRETRDASQPTRITPHDHLCDVALQGARDERFVPAGDGAAAAAAAARAHLDAPPRSQGCERNERVVPATMDGPSHRARVTVARPRDELDRRRVAFRTRPPAPLRVTLSFSRAAAPGSIYRVSVLRQLAEFGHDKTVTIAGVCALVWAINILFVALSGLDTNRNTELRQWSWRISRTRISVLLCAVWWRGWQCRRASRVARTVAFQEQLTWHVLGR